jgi:hypothetical protein
LNIDYIQAKAILIDHTVDTFIAGLLGYFCRFFARTAVSHRDEQIENHLFEPEWIDRGKLGEQIGDEGLAQLRERRPDPFFRCGLLFFSGCRLHGVEGLGPSRE